jgi:glycosyltransferase involved in cell wall biosynthesis
MSVPAVSVIIPTYNRVPLLRAALDSVHRQTFCDYEVIVVDDGSTETVGEAVQAHPTAPRVIRQDRRGPAAARNRGLKEARAGTIAFLDSDDLWHPEKLARFMEALGRDSTVRIFYGPMSPIDSEGRPVPGRTKPCHGGRITGQLFCSSFVHVPTVVCRRELLDRAGGFDESLSVCEDYDLWLRLSLHEPFGLLPEPLAWRRLHGDRLSKQCMSRNLAIKANVLRRFYEAAQFDGYLHSSVARGRLARVCFVAARAALANGEYDRAVEFCRLSSSFGQARVRTLPILIRAILAGAVRGSSSSSSCSPLARNLAPGATEEMSSRSQ